MRNGEYHGVLRNWNGLSILSFRACGRLTVARRTLTNTHRSKKNCNVGQKITQGLDKLNQGTHANEEHGDD